MGKTTERIGNAQNNPSPWPRRFEVGLEILKVVAVGTIAISSLAAPGLASVLPLFDLDGSGRRRSRKYYPSDLSRSLERLRRRGLVRLVSTSSGQALRLTTSGQALLAAYEMRGMDIKKPRCWDGKWRIVIFDVKEERKYIRDRVSQQLREWGFFLLQDSVWAYPYECEEYIELLKTGHRVRHDVLYLTVVRMAQDHKLKKHFGLSDE